MKRFSRPIILLNALLVGLVAYLLVYNYFSRRQEHLNAQLVQQAYRGDENQIIRPLWDGANPNTYLDAATRQALPEPGLLTRLRRQKFIAPDSAPVLSLAITYGRKDDVDDLLTKGADVNALDDKGSAPLQYAVLHDQRDILITLLDHHADVNHANGAGDTALHIAVAQQNVVNLQILLNQGANPNLANKAGQTPLDAIAFAAEDLHREWMLRYGDSKIAPTSAQMPKEPTSVVTKTYQGRLDSLRPLIAALQRSGAKMLPDTQNRLAGSFDLNPREIDQALAAPDISAKQGGKAAH